MDAAGVVLFGGTFDPPHRGHIELPRRLRDRALGRGWWLVFVPAARSPLKSRGPAASERDRVAMLRLATARARHAVIWTDEIDRAKRRRGPSFWIDTLRRARRVLPEGMPLRFVIGSDQAAAFHMWKDFREILELAAPLVMVRPPHSGRVSVLRDLKRACVWSESDLKRWRGWIDDGSVLGLSSTQARGALLLGSKSVSGWLPAPVRAYIAKHRLYSRQKNTGQRPVR